MIEFYTNQQRTPAERAYIKGVAYYSKCKFEKAHKQVNIALSYAPNCTRYLYLRVVIYDSLNKLNCGIRDAHKVRNLDHDCVWACEFLGYAYGECGNYSFSITHYQEALRLQPRNIHYAAKISLAQKKRAALFGPTLCHKTQVLYCQRPLQLRRKFTDHVQKAPKLDAIPEEEEIASTSTRSYKYVMLKFKKKSLI